MTKPKSDPTPGSKPVDTTHPESGPVPHAPAPTGPGKPADSIPDNTGVGKARSKPADDRGSSTR